MSDQNGKFSIKLDSGTYTVKVTKRAFQDVVRTVEVGGATLILRLPMLQASKQGF
jgi:hypothetical protein